MAEAARLKETQRHRLTHGTTAIPPPPPPLPPAPPTDGATRGTTRAHRIVTSHAASRALPFSQVRNWDHHRQNLSKSTRHTATAEQRIPPTAAKLRRSRRAQNEPSVVEVRVTKLVSRLAPPSRPLPMQRSMTSPVPRHESSRLSSLRLTVGKGAIVTFTSCTHEPRPTSNKVT